MKRNILFILTILFLFMPWMTLANECTFNGIPLRISIDKNLSTKLIKSDNNQYDYTIKGEKFYTVIPSGGISSAKTVNISSIDETKLNPTNCVFDLIKLSLLVQRNGTPESLFRYADNNTIDIIKANISSETIKEVENVFSKAHTLRLLLSVELEDKIVYFYSVSFEKEENVFAIAILKNTDEIKMTSLNLGKNDPTITNIYRALFSLIRGKASAISVEPIKP